MESVSQSVGYDHHSCMQFILFCIWSHGFAFEVLFLMMKNVCQMELCMCNVFATAERKRVMIKAKMFVGKILILILY